MGLKKGHILALVLCLLAGGVLSLLVFLYHQVNKETASLMDKGAIERVIFSESPVYYDDGVTPIGVFFEKTHRKYIHYEEAPKVFVKALIAAEDRDFFQHKGFSLKAILRALIANIRAGKVVQGGSTITQQTAKNIFKRQTRSYLAKLKELIQAFLLERKFTKEEILEMYMNQFFVTGIGKGLGIAARYFFDKRPKDLDLVEAAFIAGSVKGPNRYNPFIKKTEMEKKRARRLAKLRKDYVLANMLKAHFITQNQYLEAKSKEVPFREGRIAYRLNVLLDYIREQLDSDYFRRILEQQGIENIATSGIKIYTSINREIQQAAARSLRSHLAFLDVSLSGYDGKKLDALDPELLERDLRADFAPGDHLPFLATVTGIIKDPKAPGLQVEWKGGRGIVGFKGLRSMGQAWLRWKSGPGRVFHRSEALRFLENFERGHRVPVHWVTPDREGNSRYLALSEIPELEGGVVVLQEGMIKAMVGGFFDRFFNRAVDARRQLGSIFKPIVYAAALQLKWNTLDSLPNVRNMYHFENTVYLPRPDHYPKTDRVSMAWAGAKSENLATIWLLYHLTDRLNLREFREVATLVGLARGKGESYQEYQRRIRDVHGVVVNDATLEEAAFEEAKRDVESDMIFGGYETVLSTVRRLRFNVDVRRLNLKKPAERQIVRLDFQRLQELNRKMKKAWEQIEAFVRVPEENWAFESGEDLMDSLRGFFLMDPSGGGRRVMYTEHPEWVSDLPPAPLTPQWLMDHSAGLKMKRIWIDGLIPSEVLDWIQESTDRAYEKLAGRRSYDMEVLSKIPDFRVLVNLSYVVALSRELGIQTKLDRVLSFPLGANSISILEAALAYETLMTGKTYLLSPRGASPMVPVITKILDREGRVIWKYKRNPRRVVSKRVSVLIQEILKKVIELGTGAKAKNAVRISFKEDQLDVPIPCYGKTGTSNHFTNSSFVGFIPGPGGKNGHLAMENGYVIAAYVGYDDNRPMKTEHTTIYGSSGALPIWIDTANAVVNRETYKSGLSPADLVFGPLGPPAGNGEGVRRVPVSPLTGLPRDLSEGAAERLAPPWMVAAASRLGDQWALKRRFEPLLGGRK